MSSHDWALGQNAIDVANEARFGASRGGHGGTRDDLPTAAQESLADELRDVARRHGLPERGLPPEPFRRLEP